MLAEIISDDARDGIGRPPGGAGGDDGNWAGWKGLGLGRGGSQYPCPKGQDVATLHGFLLLGRAGFDPGFGSSILTGPGQGAKGACITENSCATPWKLFPFA